MKPLVLILCTGNSCRSQMAEGILRQSAGHLINVASAGAEPSGYVHPMAIQVMREIGLNLTGHRSKHLEEFLERAVTTVITVCDHANDVCPVFPGHPKRYHWSFADPAKAAGSKTEIESCFRSVRDQIRRVFEAYGAGLQRNRLPIEKCKISDAQV